MKSLALAIRFALVLATAAGITGCGVGSIAPLVSEADTQYDAKLVGTWQDSSTNEIVVITEASPNRYAFVFTDSDGKVGHFQGVLGRWGTLCVVDVEPEDLPSNMNDEYKSLLLPLHGAVFIDAIEPQLRFRTLQVDSLRHYLQRQPRAVAHVMRDEAVILTAPTAELRRFLMSYVPRKGALGGPNVMVRRAP